MLLDLFGLEYGQDIPVFIRPGGYPGPIRLPKPEPATVTQDLGVLVGGKAWVDAIREAPRARARTAAATAGPARLEVLAIARPAVHHADHGLLAAAEPLLSGDRSIIEGAVAIRQADDDLILGDM